MKNILYYCMVLLLLCSCDFATIKREQKYYIVNKTGKELSHQIVFAHQGGDTLAFYSKGITTKAEYEWESVIIFNSLKPMNIMGRTNLYNITDTTSLGWGFLDNEDGIYTLFGNKTPMKSSKEDDYNVQQIDWYLTVDDELLSLMKKDYSMLDKFKGYY